MGTSVSYHYFEKDPTDGELEETFYDQAHEMDNAIGHWSKVKKPPTHWVYSRVRDHLARLRSAVNALAFFGHKVTPEELEVIRALVERIEKANPKVEKPAHAKDE